MNNKTHLKIKREFDFYLEKYNSVKYPIDIYNDFQIAFSNLNPTSEQITNAIIWKFGNLYKANFPNSHKAIILEIKIAWPKFIVADERYSELETFNWWKKKLAKGGRKRFITIAFITHLVHKTKNVPIIDQHNYRAMNYLMNNLKFSSIFKKYPSSWEDIEKLKDFISELSIILLQKSDDIDKYLMMFGKELKKK
jgi:hypothetical protein